MPRNIQHRPKTRAPHGSPTYTTYIGGWATEGQKAWLMRRGGSPKLRELIDAAMAQERVERALAKRQAAGAALLKSMGGALQRAGRA